MRRTTPLPSPSFTNPWMKSEGWGQRWGTRGQNLWKEGGLRGNSPKNGEGSQNFQTMGPDGLHFNKFNNIYCNNDKNFEKVKGNSAALCGLFHKFCRTSLVPTDISQQRKALHRGCGTALSACYIRPAISG